VGDSHHDINCGRSAGVWTAGVTWGPFSRDHLEMVVPDYYCETPEEVVEIVSAVAPA
jgi:phosphoglycolate phosphatase-like HAD superfamily hydrolase